jgi:xylose isomerase
MKIVKEKLAKLDKEYKGYIEGKQIDKFFDDFEIKFAAGHWCAGDFCDRFAPAGYNSCTPDFGTDIVDQIKRVSAAGIAGIEFHESVFIDDKHMKNPFKIRQVKDVLKRYNLKPTNMNTNLFGDPRWKLGGVTNVDKTVRDAALKMAVQGAEIAKDIGCTSVALWPGSDGWDYNFEVDYGKQLDLFVNACIVINKKCKSLGLKFGIEAKLHEPREGNMVIPTTHMAILVAKLVNEKCGGTNMGVAIDYGHEQMYAVDPASMLYVAKRAGVPVVNFHVNNAKVHSNDEDRVSGTGDLWRMTDFCYAAIDTGYQGWFGEDQFTYRMEPVKAMSLSRELFANIMKKALRIYAQKESLDTARMTGDACATIDVVKKIIISE